MAALKTPSSTRARGVVQGRGVGQGRGRGGEGHLRVGRRQRAQRGGGRARRPADRLLERGEQRRLRAAEVRRWQL
jgi:hypothetical protein